MPVSKWFMVNDPDWNEDRRSFVEIPRFGLPMSIALQTRHNVERQNTMIRFTIRVNSRRSRARFLLGKMSPRMARIMGNDKNALISLSHSNPRNYQSGRSSPAFADRLFEMVQIRECRCAQLIEPHS